MQTSKGEERSRVRVEVLEGEGACLLPVVVEVPRAHYQTGIQAAGARAALDD